MIIGLLIGFVALVFALPAAFWFVMWVYQSWGDLFAIGAVGIVLFVFIAAWAIIMDSQSY